MRRPVTFFLFCCWSCLFFDNEALAQRCHSGEYSELILKKEKIIREYQEHISFWEEEMRSTFNFRSDDEPIIIPVAIHFQYINTPHVSCLCQLAIKQIELLNRDFQGIGDSSEKWRQDSIYFPQTQLGKSRLRFVIANQNHPAGYGLQEGQKAITFNKLIGDFSTQWSNYLNIFVRPTNYLGLAPFGGTGDGDGVYISTKAFGTGSGCGEVAPVAPFDQGRTLVHEIGHYFFLKHIWGRKGCDHDDGVLDTPISIAENRGCPHNIVNTCNSVDMHFNFMDYVDDDCMYLFTKGQVERMERYATNNLPHLTKNAMTVYKAPMPQCSTPTNLNVEEGDNYASLSWDLNESVYFYEIGYRRNLEMDWNKTVVYDNGLILEDIEPNIPYEWYVRARCLNGYTQRAMGKFVLAQKGLDVFPNTTFYVHAQPNPFNHQLTLFGRYADHLEDNFVKVSVFNELGVEIRSLYLQAAFGHNYFETEFSTGDWQNGLYLVRCSYKGVVKTIKVVKSDL